MKGRPKKRKKPGFTLVELLVVVAIVSLLAGMVMLVSGSATAKSEAVKIINDLRSAKTAALLYKVEHGSWPDFSGDYDYDIAKSLDKYMDRPLFSGNDARYVAAVQHDEGTSRYRLSIQPVGGWDSRIYSFLVYYSPSVGLFLDTGGKDADGYSVHEILSDYNNGAGDANKPINMIIH